MPFPTSQPIAPLSIGRTACVIRQTTGAGDCPIVAAAARGGRLWPSACALCAGSLGSIGNRGANILELGAGHGAVGSYAAALGAAGGYDRRVRCKRCSTSRAAQLDQTSARHLSRATSSTCRSSVGRGRARVRTHPSHLAAASSTTAAHAALLDAREPPRRAPTRRVLRTSTAAGAAGGAPRLRIVSLSNAPPPRALRLTTLSTGASPPEVRCLDIGGAGVIAATRRRRGRRRRHEHHAFNPVIVSDISPRTGKSRLRHGTGNRGTRGAAPPRSRRRGGPQRYRSRRLAADDLTDEVGVERAPPMPSRAAAELGGRKGGKPRSS